MRKNYLLRACSFFLLIFVGINAWADSAVFTPANFVGQGTNSTGSLITATVDKITMSEVKGYYSPYSAGPPISDAHLRLYAAGVTTFAVSPGYKITGIVIEAASTSYNGYQSSGTITTADVGKVNGSTSSTTITWTGETTTSVSFTHSKQIRVVSATVTYQSTGSGDLTPTVTSFGEAPNSFDAFITEGFTAPTATVDNAGVVTYGSSSTSVATVDPATGAVTLVAPGSTTITASYAGDATYAPSSASYTLNVGKVYNNMLELQAGATTTSTLAKIKLDGIIVTGVKGSNAYISDGQYGAIIYTSGHGLTAGKVLNGTIVAKVQLYGGATEITNFTTNGLTITDGILTPTATTISSITLPNQSNYIQLNNVTYDATANTFTDGTSTIAFYDGLTTGMTLVDGVTYNITGVVGYYNKLQVFPAIAEALPTNVAISAAQYATYVAPFDINISKSDVEAYTVNLLDGAYAVLTPVTLIPKGSVVLLKGTEGTHALYSDATQTYTALTDNLLVASTTDVIADGSQYVLAMPSGSPVGFYRANSGSTIQAGKGYLSIPLTPTAKFLGFTFDTTGIDKINTSTENNVIYNLNGQKISAPVKGVNIINGKKVVVK